ncbi:hypothetical protein ACFSTH_06370 [Paenibacillus yanchengensis]|uniref:Lipoprotein n=1 Tax=Paenibacillus yanchengensis TaxID=2035833 RepID=A0ABW4YJ70_9BACL
MKKWIVMGSLLLILSGCSATGANDGGTPGTSPGSSTPPATEAPSNESTATPVSTLTKEEAAAQVLKALKEKDHAALQSVVHPEKGVLFAPYVYIDKETALTFKAADLPTFDDEKVYEWGVQDGTGDPIKLNFADYYKRYLFNHDFTTAEEVKENEVVMSGGMIVNMKDIFPDAQFYDYHFSGFDEKYEGLDWASLIVVLEEHEGSWYVVGLVHSEWTV